MDTGGYVLSFSSASDAELAQLTANSVAQERASRLNQWGTNTATGSWEQSHIVNDTLLAMEASPLDSLEYGIHGTAAGEALFQRICTTIAFSHPQIPFMGKCSYQTGGKTIGVCGRNGVVDESSDDTLVEQIVEATYDGDRLCFDITLNVDHPSGRDLTLQRQVWSHNDFGFLVRCTVQVPRFRSLHDVIGMRLVRSYRPENPLHAHARYLTTLVSALLADELDCAGETPEGYVYGCTLIDAAQWQTNDTSEQDDFLPAVCLVDPRGRETWVVSTPDTWKGSPELPTWVQTSPDADLLLWGVSGFTYVWDGLRVRKISF